MESTMDNIFGIHATALKIRSSRAQLLAANIANADTPNFKARDIDFKQTLNSLAGKTANTSIYKTHSGHMNSHGTTANGTDILYRTPNQPNLDGNTVDLHAERAAFMENTMMYQASLRFINGKISGLKMAIRGEL